MAKVSIYLNFDRKTEEAFLFYKSVFQTEFHDRIHRMGEVPAQEGVPALPEGDKDLVMHVALPIMGEMVLMGTDILESMGHSLKQGNNVHLNLEPDTKEETDRLFQELSAGGTISMPMQDMFWGDYFGSCTDKFGINWMFNYSQKKA